MTGPLIVTALFGPGDDGWLQQLRRDHYPAGRNRVPAHLTLFRQLPPSAEDEVVRRLTSAAARPRPKASIAGVMDLGEGTALRIGSEVLEAMRWDLAEGLSGLLSAQDLGPWTPHVTVQNKVEPKEARRLQAALRGRYEGRPVVIRGLALWNYVGGPWQAVRDWSFRF
ncbi:MAG TPA: 2'-5' RNA ligase family protein [Allosphingosinicella sp.]|nr:2'-5' RNA ligase family protein [Allosphingosinicella sp.]